jgi:hypothetical protein
MAESLCNKMQIHESFIKAAQYIARLTAQQDVYAHLSDLMLNYFKTSWVSFARHNKTTDILLHHCTNTDNAFQEQILTENVREIISQVINSGFIAMEILTLPDPYMTVFLPIQERNLVKCVMLIAHKSSEKLPNDLLNTYLALAGIVGTTIERLSSEQELRKHHDQLEDLVKIRTTELELKNSRLEEEIIERKHAEQ